MFWKFARSLHSFSLLAIPAFSVFAISCGAIAIQSGVDESFFLVANPYKPNSSSYNAINDIIESYNKYIEKENQNLKGNTPKFIPAKAVYHGDSYKETLDNTVQLLNTGVIGELPSIAFGYADLISEFAKHERERAFEGFSFDEIAPGFRTIDNRIQGVEQEKNWVLPFGFSGVVNGINAPLLAYVAKKFVEVGAKISKDPQQVAFFEQVKKVGEYDEPAVANIFGPLTQDLEVLSKIKKVVFDTTKWQNFLDLMEFSQLIQDAFPQNYNYVVGIDDSARHIATLVFSMLDNNHDNMPFKLEERNGRFDLNTTDLFDSSSKQYQTLKRVFDTFKEKVQNRVLWIPRKGGEYSSNDLKEHRLIFNIGSSSGYEFSYIKNPNLAIQKSRNQIFAQTFIFPNVLTHLPTLVEINIKNLNALISDKLKPNQIAYFVEKTVDKNAVIRRVFEGIGVNGLSIPEGVEASDLVVSPKIASVIKDLFTQFRGSPENNYVILDNVDHEFFRHNPTVTSNFVISDGAGNLITNKSLALSSDVIASNSQKTLQPWELLAVTSPLRFDDSFKYKAAQVNGPVLMTFKVSPERDRNALNFAKFFLEAKNWSRFSKGVLVETVTISPSTYFSYEGNYVPAATTQLSQRVVPKSKQNNSYFKVTLETFARAALGKESNFFPYRQPAEGAKLFEGIFRALVNIYQPSYKFEDFIEDLKAVLT